MSGTIKEAHLSLADKALRYFCWGVVHTVQRPKVCGGKPAHDGPTIYFRWMIRPLVAKDYYDKSSFTQKFYSHAQCIPLDRKNTSLRWIEESLEALRKGESVIIFPEGKRNKTGQGLLKFQNGAALLALKSGAKVVPVWNAYWDFPHRYRMAIGDPVELDPVPAAGPDSEWLDAQTAKIQAAVAALEDRV